MPPETHTPAHAIRIPTEDWRKFGETAGDRRRAPVLLEFIRWYNGEPGAKMPRPPKRTSG